MRTLGIVSLIIVVLVGGCGEGGSNRSTPTAPTPTPISTKIIGLTGSLAFGNVIAGTTATATLTISNAGTAALTVITITYPAGFTGNWANGTIPAGGSRAVTVTFAPTGAASYSGTVTVSTDYLTGGVNTIGVSGTGIAASPLPTETITSSIVGDFEGWDGETAFELVNGQLWEQTNYAYSYHYAYQPKVVISRVGGLYTMAVAGVSTTISVRQAYPVTESQISGTFVGWTGSTVFPLTNGQVWQQSAYAYKYSYNFYPKVMIYYSYSFNHRMKVTGVASTVRVTRIR